MSKWLQFKTTENVNVFIESSNLSFEDCHEKETSRPYHVCDRLTDSFFTVDEETFKRLLREIGFTITATKSQEEVTKMRLDEMKEFVEDNPYFSRVNTRLLAALSNLEVYTIGDLMRISLHDLLKMRNLGRKSICRLKSVLMQYGIVVSGTEYTDSAERHFVFV